MVKKDSHTPSYTDLLKPINVLHIIGTLQLGGAENQVVTLAQALSDGRHEIHVCCLHREGEQASVLRNMGINVFCLNMRQRFWPVAVFKLYRLIRRLKVQILHTHLYNAGIWGRMVAIFAGVPVIVTTEHGMASWKKRYHLLLERVVNHYTNKIIAVSEDIRRRRVDFEGVNPKKIITISNMVDINLFNAPTSREQVRKRLGINDSIILIGTVARLVVAKRLDILLEAARIICNGFPQARFLIIGDGPLREQLEFQAEQLDLHSDHVQFLGSREDIPELMSALDVFVLSSEREGLPVAMLEAMAASKPVVATRVGGIPEVIRDGHNGLLVPPRNVHRLSEAICALLKSSTLRETIGNNGYSTVKSDFSASAISRQIAALYTSLLEKKEEESAK